jgi:hypothetical protein
VRDIVFIFGAGASYGAGDILPESPPLGFQLYRELARIYPGSWGALPEEVANALMSNFEDGMQIIYDRMSAAIPQLMREMAIYFVQFRPASGRTLYCRLIDVIRSLDILDRVLFSTLNYECVLERSLLAKQIGINLFQAIAENADVPVWKLHGSCNMFATGIEATPGVMYSAGVTFDGGIEALLDSNDVIGRCLVGTALAPVMCLYMRDKPLNVAPGAIKMLQSMWESSVRNSAAVFCVGVNPHVADAHIWQPIAEAPGDVYFVGGRTAFEHWQLTHRPNRSSFIGDRFGACFSELTRTIAEYAS